MPYIVKDIGRMPRPKKRPSNLSTPRIKDHKEIPINERPKDRRRGSNIFFSPSL